jgi:hypothetical protein
MTWTTQELQQIGESDELRIASRRPDGSLSRFTIIWVARVDDAVYVRSAYGPNPAWYKRARRYGQGRIRVGDLERDVAFTDVPADDAATHAALDAAYHAKYDHYGKRMVGMVVGPDVTGLTIRLDPTD